MTGLANDDPFDVTDDARLRCERCGGAAVLAGKLWVCTACRWWTRALRCDLCSQPMDGRDVNASGQTPDSECCSRGGLCRHCRTPGNHDCGG